MICSFHAEIASRRGKLLNIGSLTWS